MTRLPNLRETRAWLFGGRLIRRFRGSYLTMLAAALAYYAAFSLGPLLLLLGGWLGVVLHTRPELAGRYREALGELVNRLMPLQEDQTELVARNFDLIVAQLSQGALLRTALSLLVLMWAASGFFTSLQLALEVIFDVPEARSFLRRRLVALLLVVGVALVIAFEIVGGALFAGLERLAQLFTGLVSLPELELPPPLPGLVGVLTSAVPRLAVAALAFTLAFRYLPKGHSSWQAAVSGGIFSSVAVAVARWLLLITFDADRFNVVYGVITSVVVTLLWLYLALLMFLLGALLAAEIDEWRRAPPPPSPSKPPAQPN